jgi:hypothetical protein
METSSERAACAGADAAASLAPTRTVEMSLIVAASPNKSYFTGSVWPGSQALPNAGSL